MPPVSLKPLFHRNQECIGIYYRHQPSLNTIIKKLPGVRWSQTHKCWYVPLNSDSYNSTYKALNGKAELDITTLKQYLEKKKKVVATTKLSATKQNIVKPIPSTSPVWKLSGENLEALEKFVQLLKLKAYSESTIRTYRNEFIQLLQLLKSKAVNELTPDDLKRYMLWAMLKRHSTKINHYDRKSIIK